jgi:hypothetical protein
MVPGGLDVLLLAPAGECIADAIFRACRFHWREFDCVFQDASEARTYSFTDPWVWTVGAARTDFFVFRNQEAADSWEKNGAVKENRNMMFHFLIGGAGASGPELVEVAVVFDRFTPEVRSFIAQLQTSFLALMPQVPLEAA